METHIMLQDTAAAAERRPDRGIIASVIKGLAASSVTMLLMLALLPPTDAAVVRQTLAAVPTNASA